MKTVNDSYFTSGNSSIAPELAAIQFRLHGCHQAMCDRARVVSEGDAANNSGSVATVIGRGSRAVIIRLPHNDIAT